MYSKIISLLVVIVFTAGVAELVRAGGDRPAGVEEVVPGAAPLVLDQPVGLDLKSDAVQWQGSTFHLLGFHEARFALDDSARLTATLAGNSTTFDEVDYTVYAAVFDKDGHLLGTSSAPYTVQRIWLGVLVLTQVSVEMDFGRSNAYTEAATVMFAISSMDVLTPDQWQDQ